MRFEGVCLITENVPRLADFYLPSTSCSWIWLSHHSLVIPTSLGRFATERHS